jgi:hypothetical protein
MRKVLAVLATVMSCVVAGCASNPPSSRPQLPAVPSNPGLTATASAQEPLYRIDLSVLVPHRQGPYIEGAIVFLTDRILTVAMCVKTACNLATFDLADCNPRQIGLMNDDTHFQAILRGHDGGVVLTRVRRGGQIGVVLLSPDLHTSQWIPRAPGVSPRGENIPVGQGRLLDHAANVAAYFDQGTVRIVGFDGKLLGSFNAGSSSRQLIPLIRFLGQDRLLFQGGGRLEVRDYNGEVLRRLRRLEHGWGDRIAQSADGNRLLFDSLTRHVGFAQSIKEKALVLPTMGLSADGEVPNGEMVRVVDTGSGRLCFEWKGDATFLPRFGSHADIDPSGRLVAIVTQETLAIYRLPSACTVQKTDERQAD